ncbi:membrane protein insertase YidC [Fulvitalea axinellae]|uniref:Membrane protein insertase YidC n=1 Tax=Fulvitalea axinellae TaxID=1182444 RepID=A0AAU9DFV9_9BACT|nr:membrane protein insertase YidC [Fulvitalea axinellae]
MRYFNLLAMDKKQIIGFVLIALILVANYFFMKPEIEAQQELAQVEQAEAEKPEAKEKPEEAPAEVEVLSDSLRNDRLYKEFGVFANAMTGVDKESVLENDMLKVTFASKGGVPSKVELKGFKSWDGAPLMLMNGKNSTFSYKVKTYKGFVDLADLYYEPVQSGGNLTMRATLEPGKYVEQQYRLGEDGHTVENTFNLVGLDNYIEGENLRAVWADKLLRAEENMVGRGGERGYTTINYYSADGDFDYLSINVDSEKSEKLEGSYKWFSFKQRFFVSALIAEKSVKNLEVESIVHEKDTVHVNNMTAAFDIPLADLKGGNKNFSYYFGPNNYQIIKKVTPGFEDNVDLGWPIIAWFNKFLVVPSFNFLQKYISNYGIIILLLVLFVKLILSPLSYKSYLSMAKMRVLKPEIDKIKEEVGDDQTQVQMKQMELYRQVGVNPLSGCVPMLLQMPILFALFRFFPNSIELRQQSFLWAHDLSSYDVLLSLPFDVPFLGSHISGFCVLMTASTMAYTWSNNQMTTVEGPMKTMQYIMPLMFFFMLNSFSAGLTYYYFLSNLVTLGQQQVIKKFVDEDKVRKKLEENKKNSGNKKKSSFQQRLDAAMKASQEAQRKKKK